MNYYPAFLNLRNRRVILFGGGQVALRKARALVQAGAELRAISRDFSPAFLKFAKRHLLQIRKGSRVPSSLRSVSLVVCATSDPVFNRKVYERSVRAGIFVNVVDDPAHSSFIVPSVLKRGLLQIAVSTSGASPLLAQMLRKKLAREFGAEYGLLVRDLEWDRKKMKRLIPVRNDRRNHFRKLITSRLKALEGRGPIDGARLSQRAR